MAKHYTYLVSRECGILRLIRLGPWETMEADIYSYPGVWKDMPSLNDIRVGCGSFMDYDDVTEEEAEIIRLQIQERFDRMAAEKRREEMNAAPKQEQKAD